MDRIVVLGYDEKEEFWAEPRPLLEFIERLRVVAQEHPEAKIWIESYDDHSRVLVLD